MYQFPAPAKRERPGLLSHLWRDWRFRAERQVESDKVDIPSPPVLILKELAGTKTVQFFLLLGDKQKTRKKWGKMQRRADLGRRGGIRYGKGPAQGDQVKMTCKVASGSLLFLLPGVTAALVWSRPTGGIVRAETPRRQVVLTVDDLPGAIPATPTANGDLRELERYNQAIPAIKTKFCFGWIFSLTIRAAHF